jgi:hypothetical protein
LHVKVQRPPTHAVDAWSTSGHFAAHEPQWSTLVSGETHCVPQRIGAAAVQPVEHSNVFPFAMQTGLEGGQIVPQRPQLVARDRFVSQPSAALRLQSA